MEQFLLLLMAVAGAVWVSSFVQFRRLWRRLEMIVRQMAEGKTPTNFVFYGSPEFARLGSMLEKMSREADELRRRIEEEQFNRQAILSSMAEGLMVVGTDHVIRLVNPSFLRLFYLRGDPSGQTVLAALREVVVEEIVRTALAKTGPHFRDLPLVRPGRQSRHLAVSAVSTSDPEGVQIGVVIVFHDITELRQLEDVRREFVANVSHELRTPLSIFQGYIETLLDNPAMERADIDMILGVLQKHSRRLNALVEDLLTLTRLESARVSLQPEPVNVQALFDQAKADWARQLGRKNLLLSASVRGGTPDVHADPARLEQVLNNLIDNAVKHTPQDGTIEIDAELNGGMVAIHVRDNGAGIPASDLPHIFDRFYRVEKDRSRETGGTGLGLSIVKRIVELHGGSVEVESAPNRGTTFTLRLVPAQDPSGTEDAKLPPPKENTPPPFNPQAS